MHDAGHTADSECPNLMQQLLGLQSRERRMGLVVDEYGDIQGMVSLDDTLEAMSADKTCVRIGKQALLSAFHEPSRSAAALRASATVRTAMIFKSAPACLGLLAKGMITCR